jgi:proline iminopeptidase
VKNANETGRGMGILKIVGKVALGIVVGIAVLFGLGYLLTLGKYDVAKTVDEDPSLPHVTIDGVTYHAETFGDPTNPVVITIHGGPGGDYRSILSLQALSDNYFVVFYDQRGSGLSPRVELEEITVTSMIADLDSIIDYYGGGQVVNLVAHSWGAMLASAYIGQHPDKVNHLVLAEPGFLTAEFAERWAEGTKMSFSLPLLYHFLRTKFEALHVREPDDYASDDYFGRQMNMYQGADHPQAEYRCEGGGPPDDESWRFGAVAQEALFQQAVDSKGNFTIDLTVGVEQFTNRVLFMAGECQQLIGPEWQREQMQFFHDAELVVIPDAGHEMFWESPEASVAAVRAYLDSPAASEISAQ